MGRQRPPGERIVRVRLLVGMVMRGEGARVFPDAPCRDHEMDMKRVTFGCVVVDDRNDQAQPNRRQNDHSEGQAKPRHWRLIIAVSSNFPTGKLGGALPAEPGA
jgi:hypothetical protein